MDKVHYKEQLTGKRRARSFARRKDAQQFIESPKVAGSKEAVSLTVGRAADHWIAVCRDTGRNGREPVAHSTIKPYERHARYFNEVLIEIDSEAVRLSDILLEHLTKADCEALKQKLVADFKWENARKYFHQLQERAHPGESRRSDAA